MYSHYSVLVKAVLVGGLIKVSGEIESFASFNDYGLMIQNVSSMAILYLIKTFLGADPTELQLLTITLTQ